MEIPLKRQDKLMGIFQDCLVSWTWFDIKEGRMTIPERDWMFEKLISAVGLPNTIFKRRLPEEIKMAHTGTIVQRKEKETIAEDALDIFTGTMDQYAGYALPEDGEVLIGQLDDAKADTIATMADKTDPFYVIYAKGADTEESKQPFNTLQNEGGNCICACFIEGDLQELDAPESSHSPAFIAHQRFIQGEVIDAYTVCGEDMAKTVERLSSSRARQLLASSCFPGQKNDTRGEILLVFANGQTVNIIKGDKHQKYPWGEASLALGYETKKPEVPKVEPKKGIMGKAKDGKVEIKKDEPDNKVIQAALTKAVNEKATNEHAKKDNLEYMIIPPADRFSSFKDLQAWYRSFGHKDHMPAQADLEASKAHTAIPILVKPELTNASFNNLLSGNKILLAKDQKKAPAATKPEAKITPTIIPASEIDGLNKNFWPKIVKAQQNYDDGSRLIVPPDKAQQFLKDKDPASVQLGRQTGLDEFEQLSSDAWRMMVKMAPETVVGILEQYQLERYKGKLALNAALNLNKKAM